MLRQTSLPKTAIRRRRSGPCRRSLHFPGSLFSDSAFRASRRMRSSVSGSVSSSFLWMACRARKALSSRCLLVSHRGLSGIRKDPPAMMRTMMILKAMGKLAKMMAFDCQRVSGSRGRVLEATDRYENVELTSLVPCAMTAPITWPMASDNCQHDTTEPRMAAGGISLVKQRHASAADQIWDGLGRLGRAAPRMQVLAESTVRCTTVVLHTSGRAEQRWR